MFCARCGQQIPEASEICQLCGQEASIKLDPVPQPAPSKPSVPYAFVTIPSNLGPRGIGGWLLLYCLYITVLGPLIVLGLIARWMSLRNLGTPDASYLLEAVRVLYGGVVGVFLLMSKPVSLYLLKIYFGMIGAILLLAILRLASVALQTHKTIFMMPQFTSSLMSAAYAILWFAYFRKSERVRNTYGANL
jgi:hypothetical protein